MFLTYNTYTYTTTTTINTNIIGTLYVIIIG